MRDTTESRRGWPVRPLRAMADIRLGRQRSPDRAEGPNMVPYLRAANVKDGWLDLSNVKEMDFTPAEQGVFALMPGDVLVTEGAGSLAAVGASAVWSGEIDGTVCLQNTLLRLRPTPGNDPRFLMWWARHAYGSGLFAAAAGGANIYHLGAETLRTLPATIPPLSGQRAIADYLDAETARIDNLIAKTGRVLQLLRLRRRVILADALNGRLAETRTAIEQSGWRPLKALVDVRPGRARSPDTAEGDHMTPYLRAANVKDGHLELDTILEMNFDPQERAKYSLRPGDVLITEGAGSLNAVGANAAWNGELEGVVCFQNHLLRLRATGSTEPRFLAWWARFAFETGLLGSLATGAQILNLGADNVRALPVRFPDRDSQAAVVDVLDAQVGSIEASNALLDRQTTLLLERRQALITAAVTGEIEIPGVAA